MPSWLGTVSSVFFVFLSYPLPYSLLLSRALSLALSAHHAGQAQARKKRKQQARRDALEADADDIDVPEVGHLSLCITR